MIKNKLIVLFPGGGYSVDMPLLYYAKFKYELRGYEVLKISFGEYASSSKSEEEIFSAIRQNILLQIDEIDFNSYDDIVFASKSMGTLFAGWLADERNIKVKHIFLTPLENTLPYIKCYNILLVIAGTEDEKLNATTLQEHCAKTGIRMKQFEGVGHRLEVLDDMDRNLEILRQIVELY